MRNNVISYSLKGFDVFLKVPVIIIIRFGEKVFGTIYINFGGGWVVHRSPYISWFIIHKNGKITK